jgi:hypothetical protein
MTENTTIDTIDDTALASTSTGLQLDPQPMSYDIVVAIFDSFYDGTGTVQSAKDGFERLVRDRDILLAEFNKRFKVKELERIVMPAYAGMKKGQLVDRLFDRMLSNFAFLGSHDGVVVTTGANYIPSFGGLVSNPPTNAIDQRVQTLRSNYIDKITPETLKKYFDDHQAQLAARKERQSKLIAAVKDPLTLEDFEVFVRVKGEAALTPDLVARRDKLIADKNRDLLAQAQAKAATVTGVEISTEAQLFETKHTMKGHDLFVVKLADRVERPVFNQLNICAKQLGGYFSSYTKDGAISGFQFTSREVAEKFLAVANGQDVDRSDVLAQRTEAKAQTASERLLDMADNLEEASEKSLSQTRLANTCRRASMASHAQAEARKSLRLARTIRNLAQGLTTGAVVYLDRIRHKVQVEQLESMLRVAWQRCMYLDRPDGLELDRRRSMPIDAQCIMEAKMPSYRIESGQIYRVCQALVLKSGTTRMRKQLHLLEQVCRTDPSGWATVENELAESVMDKLATTARDLPGAWVEARDVLSRLSKMGITTVEELRVALREFLSFRGETQAADPVKAMELALVGQKVGVDFFPTPMDLAKLMAKKAGIGPGMLTFDPEGGSGNLACAMQEEGATVHVCEISPTLQDLLKAKGFELVGGDFMDYETDVRYDAIVMNPPFGNNADIHHLMRAVELLKPNAPVVAIIGEGAFSRSGRVESSFREWLEVVGAEVEKLPAGTFMDKTLLATTGANARLVTIINE